MSYSSDYTITSFSSSIEQRTFKNGATRAPFTLGGNGRIGLRGGCIPYIAFGAGQVPSYPKQSDCTGIAPPVPPLNVNAGYGKGINVSQTGPEVSIGGGGLPISVDAGYGRGFTKSKNGPQIIGGSIMVEAGYGRGFTKSKTGPQVTGGAIFINAGYGRGFTKSKNGPAISG